MSNHIGKTSGIHSKTDTNFITNFKKTVKSTVNYAAKALPGLLNGTASTGSTSASYRS